MPDTLPKAKHPPWCAPPPTTQLSLPPNQLTSVKTSFVPLNIIPDSDSEGEVDNTEEIQIEEALKLYQRALKLHTDGAWEEANKAYDDLFQSEIFQIDVEEQVRNT
jgi:outer membrane protein assembly factor BamD (BamD/ComL family)